MREYDFSKLVKPLHECERTYVSSMRENGLYQVLLVQDEGLTPPDVIVYVIGHVSEAKAAAEEIQNMIAAAKALIRGGHA